MKFEKGAKLERLWKRSNDCYRQSTVQAFNGMLSMKGRSFLPRSSWFKHFEISYSRLKKCFRLISFFSSLEKVLGSAFEVVLSPPHGFDFFFEKAAMLQLSKPQVSEHSRRFEKKQQLKINIASYELTWDLMYCNDRLQ